MAGLVDALKGRRIFVEFPQELAEQWLPTCEVLVQERVGAWAFDVAHLELAGEALRLFGRRACVGVRGVRTPDQARQAADLGVHFMTSPVAAPELIEAAGEVPLALGALTPNEIHYALGIGAATVQLIPADLLGSAFLTRIGALFPGAHLVPVGRFGRVEIEVLLEAGMPAVGLSAESVFSDTGIVSSDLDALRRRCQALGDLRRTR